MKVFDNIANDDLWFAYSICSRTEYEDRIQSIWFQPTKGESLCAPVQFSPTMAGNRKARLGVTAGTGNSFSTMNRAATDGNVPSPHRRISKLADNNGAWIIKPAHLKRREAPFATIAPAVSHACVKARGFRLVKVGRETPKAPNLVRKLRVFQATVYLLCRYSVCNRPEPKLLVFQDNPCSLFCEVDSTPVKPQGWRRETDYAAIPLPELIRDESSPLHSTGNNDGNAWQRKTI